MATLLAGAVRNEIRIGACLSFHLNCFFPSSSPPGLSIALGSNFLLHFGNGVPQSQHPQVGCQKYHAGAAPPWGGWGTGHEGIHARRLLGCPTQPQHPHHLPEHETREGGPSGKACWASPSSCSPACLLVILPLSL